MKHHKKILIAGAVAGLLTAGSALAVPFSQSVTITGVGDNVPGMGPPNAGTVYLFGGSGDMRNQVTKVALGLPTDYMGNPVEYVLDRIVVSGMGTSEIQSTGPIPPAGDGLDLLTDITGNITLLDGMGNPNDGTTNFTPFAGVGLGCTPAFPGAQKVYTTANFGDPDNPDADDGTWTGFCPGGPYLLGTYPDPSAFTADILGDSMFDVFFWSATNQGGDEPEARLDGLTVTFIGQCTANCPDDNGGGQPTPAPATLALFGLGLAGLGAFRRRRTG